MSTTGTKCHTGTMGGDLERRVAQLEEQVRRLEGELEWHRAAPAAWPSPEQQPPTATWDPPTVVPQFATEEFELPDAETVLKWAGIALVVLAIGFAVSTAISRGWIGPELQLAGALLLAGAMVVAGIRLRPTRPAWTHALCTGGVLGLFVTFASDLFGDQAPDEVAFAAIAVVGIGGGLLAHHTLSEWVATATLLGSVTAWFVVGEGVGPFGAGLAWLSVAVAGSILLAARQRWTALHLLAHLTGMVVGLSLAGDAADRLESAGALAVGAVLFASFTWRAGRAVGEPTAWQQIEVQAVTLAPPWAAAVVANAIEVDGQRQGGTVALAVAAGTIAVVTLVRSKIALAQRISLLIGASVVCSIGLALVLSTTAAFVAIAVQAAGLIALTRATGDDPKTYLNAAVLGAISLAFVVGRTTDAWVDDAAIADDLAHLAVIAALTTGGWWLRHRVARRLTALGTLALVMTWLGSVLVHLPQGQAIVSASWAAIGIAVFVVGTTRKLPEAGAAGLAVIAITVGKLLTVDLQEVDALWRAALFLAVGLGIMRLGFLLPRLTRDTADGSPGASSDEAPTT